MNAPPLALVLAVLSTPAAAQESAPPPPPQVEAEAAPQIEAAPPSTRYFGVTLAANLGLVGIEAQVGSLYAFASANLGIPLLTDGTEGGGAIGIGYTRALSTPRESMWYFDAFATVLPGFHSAMGGGWRGEFVCGIGLGAGVRYLHRSGLTVGFKVPLLGVAVGPGTRSLYTADYRTSEMTARFYLGALIGLPIASVGYRF